MATSLVQQIESLDPGITKVVLNDLGLTTQLLEQRPRYNGGSCILGFQPPKKLSLDGIMDPYTAMKLTQETEWKTVTSVRNINSALHTILTSHPNHYSTGSISDFRDFEYTAGNVHTFKAKFWVGILAPTDTTIDFIANVKDRFIYPCGEGGFGDEYSEASRILIYHPRGLAIYNKMKISEPVAFIENDHLSVAGEYKIKSFNEKGFDSGDIFSIKEVSSLPFYIGDENQPHIPLHLARAFGSLGADKSKLHLYIYGEEPGTSRKLTSLEADHVLIRLVEEEKLSDRKYKEEQQKREEEQEKEREKWKVAGERLRREKEEEERQNTKNVEEAQRKPWLTRAWYSIFKE